MLAIDSLPELIDVLLNDFRDNFDLEAVSLSLLDSEYELRRLLEEQGIAVADYSNLTFLDNRDELKKQFGAKPAPILGSYVARQHSAYFRTSKLRPQSIALLPLVRHEKLVGCLCLGSLNSSRFSASAATDFLSHLAMVVAVSIENAVNYEMVKRHGLTDFLTGVNNRRAFDQRLNEEVMRASRRHEPLSCLFLDVDYFKKVNDNHGHEAGDAALQQVADIVRQQLRASDVLARYGGEEFAALLPNSTEGGAAEIAERIRRAVEAHEIQLGSGKTLKITISIGVASLVPDSPNQEAVGAVAAVLVETADRALYQAKGLGRNQVVCASLLV